MANPRYSASRFGCFDSCKLKYKWVYVDEFVAVGKQAELATKGLAFHEIAEAMDSSKSIDDLNDIAKGILEGMEFDQEKYPVIKAIPRFFLWWQEYIRKWESEGFVLEKESWQYSALEGKSIVGAIDVLLINESTKEVIIIDFKTGSTAKVAGYENQLLLYAYMMKNKLKTKYDKIKTYLFFPLAGLKDEDVDNPDSVKKMMLKTFKEMIFSEDDVKDVLNNFKKIIKESDTTDWENLDLVQNSNMSFACSWCDFCGHPEYCPVTYKSGMRFPRKAKIMTKAELKELQKNESEETS